MDYTFASGSAAQQRLWREGVGFLLNLPDAAMPLSVEVSFDPPSEIGQTSFAETTWTYDSAASMTRVRNDAPGFGLADAALIAEAQRLGLDYNPIKHFHETAVHELGHSLYAALPHERRLAIAAMFGATTDDPAVLSPPGSDWHDRIIEAIAETFKEAFLPARHRVFANRTNIKLSYAQYPSFRRLIREAMPEVHAAEGEPLEPGEKEVPSYNLDIFKQGGYRKTERFEDPAHPELGDVGEYLIGDGGFWDTKMVEVYVAIGGGPLEQVGSTLGSQFNFEAWVIDGTTLRWTLPLGLAPFVTNGGGVLLEILGPVKSFFNGRWTRVDEVTKETPDGFRLVGDATAFLPPANVTDSMVVNATNFGTTTRKCHKTTYRLVQLEGQLELNMGILSLSEHEALREARLYPVLAPFPFIQAGCGGKGEPGLPVVVPEAAIVPTGAFSGRQPKNRPLCGFSS